LGEGEESGKGEVNVDGIAVVHGPGSCFAAWPMLAEGFITSPD